MKKITKSAQFIAIALLISFLSLNFNSRAQHIQEGTTGAPGDIYHLGGNIGIGTEKPETSLQISSTLPVLRLNKNISSSSFPTWDIENNGRLYFKYGQDGHSTINILSLTRDSKLGLGVDYPETSLHIKNSNPTLRLEKKTSSSNHTWDIENTDVLNLNYREENFPMHTAFTFTREGKISSYNYLQLSGDNNGGTDLFISSNGNVGIGTTSPTTLFELNSSTHGSWTTPFIKVKKSTNSDLAAFGFETNLQHWVIAAISSSSTGDGFWIKDIKNNKVPFKITDTGVVEIHDKLWVADEVVVQATNPWPDFVFKDNYKLMPLEHLKIYINKNGHLPDMPTSEDVKKEGIKLAQNQALMLQKIEELTLYLINLKEENDELKERIVELEKR